MTTDQIRAQRLQDLLANLGEIAKAVLHSDASIRVSGDTLTIAWGVREQMFAGPEALSNAFMFLTAEIEKGLARLQSHMAALQAGSVKLSETAAMVRTWRGEKPS